MGLPALLATRAISFKTMLTVSLASTPVLLAHLKLSAAAAIQQEISTFWIVMPV